MASILEKCANVLLIITCTGIIGNYSYQQIHKAAQTHSLFKSGTHIDGTATLALSSAPRTLIIATSSSCPYCMASMPSYKDLADAARKVGTRVIAVSGEPVAVNGAYLASHGVTVDQVFSQADSGVYVRQVPSLILVRRDGVVIDSWTGAADQALERSVMKAVGTRLN